MLTIVHAASVVNRAQARLRALIESVWKPRNGIPRGLALRVLVGLLLSPSWIDFARDRIATYRSAQDCLRRQQDRVGAGGAGSTEPALSLGADQRSRSDRVARRRRLHVAHAAPACCRTQDTGVRDETRYRRVPDESVPGRRPDRALDARPPRRLAPIADAGDRRVGWCPPGTGDQRGVAAAADQAGGQTAHLGRRHRSRRGTGLRRRPAGNRCRQHRLQPLGLWTDTATGIRRAGADPDQPVPPAPLARRHRQTLVGGQVRSARPLQATGQRHRRRHRSA